MVRLDLTQRSRRVQAGRVVVAAVEKPPAAHQFLGGPVGRLRAQAGRDGAQLRQIVWPYFER